MTDTTWSKKAEDIYFLAPVPRDEIHSLNRHLFIYLKKNPTDLLMQRTKTGRGKEGERISIISQ